MFNVQMIEFSNIQIYKVLGMVCGLNMYVDVHFVYEKKYMCPQKMWFLFVSQLTGMPEVGHLVFVKSAAYDVYKCVLGLWQALSPNESDGD
jgi:hypothetical protein